MARQFTKVLAPIDFSETSRAALAYALDLVSPGGVLLVCHVVDDIPLTYGYVGIAVPPPELTRRLSEEAAREMDAFVPKSLPEGVRLDARILHGAPFAGVVGLAREEKVDLIVMGTHGRKGLDHAFFGSVAENVVKKSPVPVTVINPYTLKRG